MTGVLDLAWPRTTSRLSLRPCTPDDLPAVFAYRTLPEVGEWLPRRPTSYDAWLVSLGTTGLERTLVVERDGEVVGDLYLHLTDAWAQAEASTSERHAEVGWVLAPAHQGHGYATEAVRSLLSVCFDELSVRRVTAVAFAGNPASVAVMERLGMRHEATYRRDSLHRDRGWVDSVLYALLAEEWVG